MIVPPVFNESVQVSNWLRERTTASVSLISDRSSFTASERLVTAPQAFTMSLSSQLRVALSHFCVGPAMKLLLVVALVAGVPLLCSPIRGSAQANQAHLPTALLAPALTIRDEDPFYVRRVVALCGPIADRDRLLREEESLSERGPDADQSSLVTLACLRARLDGAHTIARPGYLMPLGTGWSVGARRVLVRALAMTPLSPLGAELLGVIAAEAQRSPLIDSVATTLAHAVNEGIISAAAVRSCIELNDRAGRFEVATMCARRALSAGVDSTWQLLYLARVASRASDTAGTSTHFTAALRSAHDRPDLQELSWQLKWFLDPVEWDDWQQLPDSLRGAWVGNLFASRDVRDGRPAGSRLVEHFARLDYIEQHFRLDVPRKDRPRFLLTATPEFNDGHVASVSGYWEPGLVAAEPFRFAKRWAGGYDDRATVWMRFGRPGLVRSWTGTDTVRPNPGQPPGQKYFSSNSRTLWRYNIGGKLLLLQFEPERLAGTTEPTRLVEGVLGSYLCGIDAWRCAVTARSAEAGRKGGRPVPPELIGQVRQQDAEFVGAAITQDDNSPRFDRALEVAARLHRVWNGAKQSVEALVPWAVRAGDLRVDQVGVDRIATVTLELRQWNNSTQRWLATTQVRRLRIPSGTPEDAKVTGLFEAKSDEHVSSWSLTVRQDTTLAGRRWGDKLPSLASNTLSLSDLILGSPRQGQTWKSLAGTAVPLAPLGAFDRKEPLTLFWQVRSSSWRSDVQTTIAFFVMEQKSTRPALQVQFLGALEASTADVLREINASRLGPGAYRLQVVVRDRLAGTEVRREVPLLLK